jgi:RNA polymerase primary sigma factor
VGARKSERAGKKSTATSKKAPKAKAKSTSAKPTKAAKANAPAKSKAPAKARDEKSKPPASKKNDREKKSSKPSNDAKVSKDPKQDLITLGRSKGFLTYDDVADALPSSGVGPDQMDDVLSALDNEDIAVVENAKSAGQSSRPPGSSDDDIDLDDDSEVDSKSPTRADLEAASVAEAAAAKKSSSAPSKANDEDQYKSNDPVRMYLRKMGSVALLTREGEVEIAKRIEEGENEVLAAILGSPVAVREIIDVGERLRSHKIRVKDIVRDAEDEEQEFDEEEADRRIIRLIDRVKRLDKKALELLVERENAQDG